MSSRLFSVVALLLLSCLVRPVAAVERLSLRLPDLQGTDYALHGVELTLDLRPKGAPAAVLRIARAQLPGDAGSISGLEVHCPQASLQAQRLECAHGSARLGGPFSDGKPFAVAMSYDTRTARLQLSAQQVPLFRGRLSLRLTAAPGALQLQLHGKGLAAAAVVAALPQAKGFTADGALDLDADYRSGAAGAHFSLGLQSHGLAFSDPSGNHAAEKLDAGLQLTGERRGRDAWSIDAQTSVHKGGLYLAPVYLEPPAGDSLLGSVQAVWTPAEGRLRLERWQWRQPGVLEASGSAELRLDAKPHIAELQLQAHSASLKQLYPVYLQPFLHHTALSDLELAGEAGLQATVRDDQPTRLALDTHNLYLDDGQGRFGAYDVQLHGVWGGEPGEREIRLGWQGGHLLALRVGAGRIGLLGVGDGYRLVDTTHIPLLDGNLVLEQLQLTPPLGGASASWRMGGYLTPVSMEAVSHAMGWPSMAGQLSGMVPSVSYHDGRIDVGGMLLVRAFGGEVTVNHLDLQQPFGLVPVLHADLKLRHLDLEQLTRTFSFGRITGSLDGEVTGLEMRDWSPASFDARLYTTPGDRSVHRISQRAVENLSSIGGSGVGGALSRTFLGMFEEFSYDKLGLSCRLVHGVCKMNGVAPAQNGYYIVKGGGLPRIDVIGFVREVDWNELVARLVATTHSQGPVVR